MPDEAAKPAPARGFPWVRVLIGAAIAAGVIAFAVTRAKPNELELAARFEPAAVPAGSTGKLILGARPGPDAPAGARLLGSPQVVVVAPPEVKFDRPREYFLNPDEELVMHFTVAAGAAPGARELKVYLAAELSGAGSNLRRPAYLRRTVSLTVGPPRALEQP